MTDMRSLIDELGAKSLECRALLADVRSATKDLRHAVREAQDTRLELEDAVRKMVASDITEAVKLEMDALTQATKDAMADSIEKVGKKFDELANLFMTGDQRGRPADGLTLQKIIERR